ncbi:MAG: hypothetical protein Q8L76_17080, partial [Cypionkella sp.]|nr:hypothetical protein [Cypionkella sp.]
MSGGGANATIINANVTLAEVDGTASDIILTGLATVSAQSLAHLTAEVDVTSIAVGLFALAAGGGTASIATGGSVAGHVSGVEMTAGGLSVSALSGVSQRTTVWGMTVGATAGVGASVAAVATSRSVAATVGGSSGTYHLGSLTVAAEAGGINGSAIEDVAAYASGGGLLLGVQSTSATATNTSQVDAGIESGATLVVSGNAVISASGSDAQQIRSKAVAGGLIGVGAAYASGTTNTGVSATIGELVQLTAGNLSIWAVGSDAVSVGVVAGAYGLASGSAATATTHITSDVFAGIVDASSSDRKSTVNVIGTFQIAASHLANPDAEIDTSAYGVLAGSGAAASNTIGSTVAAELGNHSVVAAGTLDIN